MTARSTACRPAAPPSATMRTRPAETPVTSPVRLSTRAMRGSALLKRMPVSSARPVDRSSIVPRSRTISPGCSDFDTSGTIRNTGVGAGVEGAAATTDDGAAPSSVGASCTICSEAVVDGRGATGAGVVSRARVGVAAATEGAIVRGGAERAVTAATRLSVRRSVLDDAGVSSVASATPSLVAEENVASGEASSLRGAGSRVITTTTVPSSASPNTDAPTARTTGVPVDVSSALSAGLPGRISGVRLTGRNGATGSPHCAHTSSSSPTRTLQDGQVVLGTVMPWKGRRNVQRVGCPRDVRFAAA